MPVHRGRERVRPAELLELLTVRARAFLLDQADLVREISLRHPFYARLAMRHWPTIRSRPLHGSFKVELYELPNQSA
jgi:hypothetical protein